MHPDRTGREFGLWEFYHEEEEEEGGKTVTYFQIDIPTLKFNLRY